MNSYDIITIIGPTASGKTNFACHLAYSLKSEIISGDSRQVYRQMDIGTGKDLSDYEVRGCSIPYHLIDICDPGEKYNIFEYQRDFHEVYRDLKNRIKLPILCGGSGLYIESVLREYSLPDVPVNHELRTKYLSYPLDELAIILAQYKDLHNTTDLDNKRRVIRAIEIEEYKKSNPVSEKRYPPINSLTLGVDVSRDIRRARISARLKTRLSEGMIEEVENILRGGVDPNDLIYYGLEYKFVTQFVIGEITRKEMENGLEIAIHQFAKRQMTWFRGMERRGLKVHWIDGLLPMEDMVGIAIKLLGN